MTRDDIESAPGLDSCLVLAREESSAERAVRHNRDFILRANLPHRRVDASYGNVVNVLHHSKWRQAGLLLKRESARELFWRKITGAECTDATAPHESVEGAKRQVVDNRFVPTVEK